MTLPLSKQARRVFHGMLPEYYHKVSFSYPDSVTTTLTFWQYDYQLKTVVIAAVIDLIYTSAEKTDLSSVERIYPVDGPEGLQP